MCYSIPFVLFFLFTDRIRLLSLGQGVRLLPIVCPWTGLDRSFYTPLVTVFVKTRVKGTRFFPERRRPIVGRTDTTDFDYVSGPVVGRSRRLSAPIFCVSLPGPPSYQRCTSDGIGTRTGERPDT